MTGFFVFLIIIYLFYNSARVKDLQDKVRHMEQYLAEHTKQSHVAQQVQPTQHEYVQKEQVQQAGQYSFTEAVAKAEEAAKEGVYVTEPASAENIPQPIHRNYVDTEALVQKERERQQQEEVWRREQVERGPGVLERFVAWMKVDWMMKVGGFFVILGAGWFISFAIENGWITPQQRILLGLFVGVVVIGIALYRAKSFITQGAVLLFVGASIVTLTLYADQELMYGVFPPRLSLVLMFATASLLGVVAVWRKHKPLAYADVLLATVAPSLIAAELSLVQLNSYFLIMTLGAVWVVVLTGWRELTLLSLVIVYLISMPQMVGLNSSDATTGLAFACIFGAVYFAVSLLSARRVREATLVDILVALGTGVYILRWVMGAAPEGWDAPLLLLWALVFAFGTWFVVEFGAGMGYLYSYFGIAITYVGVATALLLNGPALTIAYIFEATLLLVVGHYLSQKRELLPYLSAPMVIPFLLSLSSFIAPEWQTGVLHRHAVVTILMTLAFCSASVYFWYAKEVYMYKMFAALSSAYIAVLSWLCTFALVANDTVGIFIWTALFVAGASIATVGKMGKGVLYTFIALNFMLLMGTPGVTVTHEVLVIVFTICATTFLIAGFQMERRPGTLVLLSMPLCLSVLQSVVYVFSPEWQEGILHWPAAVLSTLFLSSVVIYLHLIHQQKTVLEGELTQLVRVQRVFSAVSGVYASLLLWLCTFALVTNDMLAVIVWGILFMVSMGFTVVTSFSRGVFHAYATTGLLLLLLYPGMTFTPAMHTVIFAVVVPLALIAGYFVYRSMGTLYYYLAYVIVPIFMSFESAFSPLWKTGVVSRYLAVMLFMLVMFDCMAIFFMWIRKQFSGEDNEIVGRIIALLWGFFGVYAARLVWLVVHALTENEDTGTMITLFMYTFVGSLFYVLATYTKEQWQRTVALTLFAFVILRLLLVEVWEMELIGRIITFIVIGVVLISVAWFIGNRRKKEAVHIEQSE